MKKLFLAMLAASLAAAVLPAAAARQAYALSFEDYGEEIPVVENVEGVSRYSKDTQWQILSAEEAKEAGVTVEGGYVARATLAKSNGGLTLDFSAQEIPIYEVESIDFRVRAPKGTSEIRISVDQSTRWVMRYTVKINQVGKFISVSLGADGYNFWEADAFTMKDLANGEGNLGAFELMFFTTSPSNESYAYLDSATVTRRTPDTEEPVIDYKGGTDVTTSAGRHYNTVISATAYDEFEDAEVEVEYLFSEGAVDENGILLVGEHTLTLRAADNSGNVREIEIALHVGEKDTSAPEIVFPAGEIETVYTVAGAYPDIRAVGRDDIDDVTVEADWQEGALDEFGRLTVGEHICTLICTDGTGNRTERTVRYVVTATERAIETQGEAEETGCGSVCGGCAAAVLALGSALLCFRKRRM